MEVLTGLPCREPDERELAEMWTAIFCKNTETVARLMSERRVLWTGVISVLGETELQWVRSTIGN